MSLLSKRLVSIVASTALLSLVSAGANAQTIDVLTGLRFPTFLQNAVTATYTFSSSMILNSVGFITEGNQSNYQTLSYSIGGVNQAFNRSDLSTVDGISWLTLSSPVTVLANQVVSVTTLGQNVQFVRGDGGTGTRDETHTMDYVSINPGAPVTFSKSPDFGYQFTNSNLRVSNPGANVAPEPGSFALALTGGAALLGICIRRRRNAG